MENKVTTTRTGDLSNDQLERNIKDHIGPTWDDPRKAIEELRSRGYIVNTSGPFRGRVYKRTASGLQRVGKLNNVKKT